MESYRNLNNALIGDSSTLERTHIERERTVFKNSLYGRRFTVPIPKDWDYLTEMNVKLTLTTAGDNSNVATYPSSYHFKLIQLRTARGEVLGSIYPKYSVFRIDELNGTPLGLNLADMTKFQPVFNATTSVTWLPLFFGMLENGPIRTSKLEDLELYFEVEDDFAKMGLDAGITAADYEVHMKFVEPRKRSDDFAKKIITYDVSKETTVNVVSGNTTVKKLLKQEDPAYLIIMDLSCNDREEREISSYSFETAGIEWLNKTRRNSFKLFAPTQRALPEGSSTFNWFNQSQSRKNLENEKDLVCFTGEMYPTFLTCNFADPQKSCGLDIMYEYVNIIEIDDKGMIKVIPTGLNQYNVAEQQSND